MSIIKFSQFIAESGDLQLLHTAANISVPKIHSTETGSHVAVHRTSTEEHANWLKGKFENALKHNPSRAHIKVAVHNDDSGHSVHVTHTPPKKLKEETLLEVTKMYNTGDHVHLHTNGTSFRGNRVLKHGIVGKSTDRTAEVHWEDGTKSKHMHTTGNAVGEKGNYVHSISHNRVHDPDAPGYFLKQVSNDEHKAHLKKVADEQDAKRQHQESHRAALEKLQQLHHSQLKPHHLEALHHILDKAKNGED